MSEKTLKRPEVLAPAGTLEKLKVAVDYGADAVFVGGQAYGLRSRAGNFTMEELQEGINYAHANGAKVHVAANMVTHEGNETGAGEWFRELRDLGLDAVIVSDPALMVICLTEAPGLEVHVSTQASTTTMNPLLSGKKSVCLVLFWRVKLELLKLKKFVNTPHLKLKLSFMAQCVSVIQGVVSFLII